MTKQKQVYKCEICGNIVEILHSGVGELVCCNQPMKLINEELKDGDGEKHLPFIEKILSNSCEGINGIKIKIGEIEHPMEEKHYVEWIEITTEDGEISKKFLKPIDKPEANFETRSKITEVREYCNVHGMWKLKI